MILYQDGLIELDYDPASDILSVKWPDLPKFTLSEVSHSFQKLIDTIRHYDIKLLLLDSRSSSMVDVPDEEYRRLIMQLSQDFAGTRLQKIARVQSPDPNREERARQVTSEAETTLPESLAFKNFSGISEALNWLKEK